MVRPGAPREALFVTTKLWIQDAGHDSARKALARSLERLQLDYLGLYLIHRDPAVVKMLGEAKRPT